MRIVPVLTENVTPNATLVFYLAGTHRVDFFGLSESSQLEAVRQEVVRCLEATNEAPSAGPLQASNFGVVMEAAHAGDRLQQYLAGRIMEERGVPGHNPAEAARWFRKAAQQGHAESAYQLALAYENGQGVLPSRAEWLRWLYKAAQLGDVRAQAKFGLHLLNSRPGDPQTAVESAEWFSRAAAQGSEDALYQLSVLRLGNSGLNADYAKALQDFRSLAEHHYTGAQYHLAWMLEHGRGTLPNHEEALMWAKQAAAQGYDGARQLVHFIESRERSL